MRTLYIQALGISVPGGEEKEGKGLEFVNSTKYSKSISREPYEILLPILLQNTYFQ